MELLVTYNDENITEEELKSFRHRRAVRGVIFDSENNIALIHAVVENYYTLPGGGVDKEESFDDAIIRECKEEIGCDIEIISTIGETFEYRKNNNLINDSVGYIGKVIGEKGVPIFTGTEDESEKNSIVEWVAFDEAIEIMKNIPVPENLYTANCIKRDLVFLEKAKEFTNK